MRKARVALARRLAIIMHAMLRNETEFAPALAVNPQDRRPHRAPARSDVQGGSRRRRGLCMRQPTTDYDFNLAALHPVYPIKRR